MTDRPTGPRRTHLPPAGSPYWDQLAHRIERAAAGRTSRGALAWLGERGARVAGLCAASAAVLLIWALQMPAQSSAPPEVRGSEWVRALTPFDSLGRTLAVERAPGLGAFVLAGGQPAARPAVGRGR